MNYQHLLEKLVTGTATEAEKQEWLQWLQTADEESRRRLMQDWAEQKTLRPGSLPANPTVLNNIARELIGRQALGTKLDAPVVRMRAVRKRWLSIAAAAAILALLAGAVYLYQLPIRQPAVMAANTADKAPGKNRAILTLTDGRTVFLDSSTTGELASQGGMQLTQHDAGSLTYSGHVVSPDSIRGPNTLQTPRGGQFRLTLADGTRVWLNSASSIRYPLVFNADKREVFVTGEAYFEVAANKVQPFIVHTNNQKITVLGTHFNVNAYDDEEASHTTLLEGSVEVKRMKVVAQVTKPMLLQPGQQATLAYDNDARIQVSNPDLSEVTAWKDGEFRFHNTKITTIMRQIARWYDVEVEYQGPVPTSEFYGVIPRKEYVSQLLKALALTKNVHFKTTGNKIIVMAGPG